MKELLGFTIFRKYSKILVVLGLSIIFIFGMNARVQATNISYKEFPTVFQYQLPETIVINAFPVIAVAVDPLQEDALAAIRSETKTVAAIEVVSSGEEVQEVVTQPVEAKAAKTNFTARNTEVVSKKEDTTAQTQKQAEPKTELASINVAVPKPLPDYTEKKTVLAEEENSPKAVPAKAVSFRYPKEKSEVYVETTPVKVDEEPKEVKNEPPPKPEPEIKIPEVVTPAPVQPVQEEPLPENDKSEAPKELASIPAPVVVAPEKEFKVLNSAILDTSSSSLTKRFGSAPIGGFIQKPKVVLSETGFKKGEIIVKFKSTGPYTVDTCAECLIKHKQSFKNYVRDNSNSLDQINQLAGVKDARSFFDRHGLNAEEALYKQRLINQKALEHFQIRTNKFQAASQKPLADMSSIYVLKVPEDSNIQQLVALYQNDPHVEFAQPNYIFKKTAFPSDPPNDTYYASDLWGLNNIGQNVGQVGTADSDIDAPEAWAQNTLGAGIVVAVNDSGVDVTHEDLSSQIWVNPGETAGNGVDDDLNGYIDDINGWDFTEDDNNPSDGDGHGTHVAGTIAAIGNNSQGVIGVAPSAEIMVVKGLDDDGFGTSESLANGIVYAAQNGADVINNSWGCTPSFACASDFIIETAVRNAHDLGVVLVFAAGNDDADVALASPQNMDEPIVVAATDNRDGIASFSNYGNTVDISAPGVFVLSTYPGDNYAYSSGTSMSSPHVAGAAAVLLTHPKYNFSNEEVETILKGVSDDIGADSSYGAGRLNLNEAITLDRMEPNMTAVSNKTADTGENLSFTVSASDPNSDSLTMTARLSDSSAVTTIGATFTDNGNSTGTFSWTPNVAQVGLDPTIIFKAEDALGLYDEDSALITVALGAVCGDGAQEGDEECDDGNVSSGDGCSSSCTLEVCGNGIVDVGEDCDDGNTTGGDGCSATCASEVCGNGVTDVGEDCDDGNTTGGDGCSATCTTEVCGNGITDVGEECDDGNVIGGDGCSATCKIEVCGDGVVDSGEECDDGNITNGDGCDSSCLLEGTCGDGNQEPGEQCDDGNTAPGDGCNATCQLEVCGNGTVDFGEGCDDGNTTPLDGCNVTCQDEYCGDGIVNDDGAEQCDDGNVASGDGCSAACTTEVCGNGIVDFGEGCDDGNTTPLDGCNATCQDEYCGDGIVNDTDEQCDDGNIVAGDGCSPTCFTEVCGNAIIDPGEGCDDGNTTAGDGCSDVCIDEYCGDGVVNDTDEQCDDGNTTGGDGCSAICNNEVCGNAIVDPGEGCDDGNITAGDGCSDVCVDEFCGDGVVNDTDEQCDDGNTTAGDGCSAICNNEVCGNGFLDPTEQCDDGNTTDGDGCSDTCFIEVCGNGIVDPGEECDDGNSEEVDGCDSSCNIAGFCGDNVCEVELGELCTNCVQDCGVCRGLRPR